MNHLLLLLGASLALTSLSPDELKRDNQHWLSFKRDYNKTYESDRIESLRQTVFMANKRQVEQFNAKGSAEAGFELGLNHLADRSNLEAQSYSGFKLPAQSEHLLRNSPEADKFISDILNDKSVEVPDEVDWRKVEGRVTRVKDQGDCASGWAFAATGALEGQERVRSGEPRPNETIELSEQNLVDCTPGFNSCDSGLMIDAFNYVRNQKDIDSERSYPYEAALIKCRFRKSQVAFTDAGGAILQIGDEDNLKKVVAKFGPVAVAIDASSELFQLYKTGIYMDDECSSGRYRLTHAVLVVGYGTDPEKGDFWILKNSWGSDWGEEGYMRMARNRQNMCGIATMATIPIF